jgi:hypothetical protein
LSDKTKGEFFLKYAELDEAMHNDDWNEEERINFKGLLDEAKADFVKQSISLADARTVLKDVDGTKIICFPVDVFLKWFGEERPNRDE